MYTDQVSIQNVTINTTTGKKVNDGDSYLTKARVESSDLRKKDSNGNTVIYSKLIIVPSSKTVNYLAEIEITKIGGVTTTNEKTCIAEIIFKTARYSPHHIEVYCK